MDRVDDAVSNVPTAPSVPTTDNKSDAASTGASSANDVQSRFNMSDEQREIKRRFEAKQREEAQRSAQAERVAKKKVSSVGIIDKRIFNYPDA